MQHGIRVWLGLGLGAVRVREETRTVLHMHIVSIQMLIYNANGLLFLWD